MTRSEQLFERAKKVLPGGVNSPVRAFRAVGGSPRFIVKGLGSHILDEDGLEYIDYVGSWGPMVLGHSHPDILKAVYDRMVNGLSFGAPTALEVEMAEKMVSMVPHIEMVRMVNSGTEAVMSALRLARGATGRDKIIKFEGCYHGHSDSMLVGAGSGALTQGEPDSKGVTRGAAQDTLMAQYNDLASVERLLDANPGEVAAVIVEPVAANMGVVPPKDGFLQGLRDLCDKHGALLIFDEVITGFRLAAGGAQAYFGVRADLVTFGKIIGGGMPVGAYAGSRVLMEQVAPCGPVYQAGTLSGNPVAMAAGLAQLQILTDHPEIYAVMEASAQYIANHLRASAEKHGIKMQVNQVGSLLCPYFTDTPVGCFAAAKTSDTKKYAKYFNEMLLRGVYLAPSQFEAMFVSSAHTQKDLAFTVQAADESLAAL
ncbi:glutamate-1-semialdehyde 2,1-aminomutase [Agathobaculum sp. LCP25S3_E8]|uniref:glutamate-1-semialdehyde 2,1-aminomutase n=1 Tax=Agathobaculum sp. LCP25S3_E8 TaxID=3438735 RepID=UPI003F90AD28